MLDVVLLSEKQYIHFFRVGDVMRLKLSKLENISELSEYTVYQETISENDNYTMYKITRASTSNPLGILYHCMYYLEGGKVAPQEIAVNSESDVIEKVTLFISKNKEHMVELTDYLINEKMFLCGIELNECTTDWKGRFHKIGKESVLLWGEYENLIYFIFSDSPKQLTAYPISRNFRILVDKDDNLQGFCLFQI